MSCLFAALGQLLGRPHHRVRHEICDFMAQNLHRPFQGTTVRQWIEWQGERPHQYIARMRGASSWGGAMEIAMATQLYHVDVTVAAARDQRRLAHFVMDDTRSARHHLFITWTGNHYEAWRRSACGGMDRA